MNSSAPRIRSTSISSRLSVKTGSTARRPLRLLLCIDMSSGSNSARAGTVFPMEFKKRTVLITGGTSGIGREMTKKFHQRNNTVILGHDEKKLDAVKKTLRGVHPSTRQAARGGTQICIPRSV